ncbi:MAG: HAD family phosphatase [Pseudomonadota bacterium]
MNVVFDFGAVLFTWKPAELLARSFPQQAGTAEAAAQLAHAVFAHADWTRFDQGLLEMDVVIARTSERLGLDATALRELVEHIGERLHPMPQTVALLAQLHALRSQHPAQHRDMRLYYLSNMPAPYARELERRHAFLQWFDGGIFSGDVRHTKPDPAIYQLLQSRYTLAPAQTLFIDDLAVNVQAARGQGWHAIQFESAAQLRADMAAQFGLLWPAAE